MSLDIINSYFTSIASNLRSILNLSNKMNLSSIDANTSSVNNHIDTESSLLDQISDLVDTRDIGKVKLIEIANEGTSDDIAYGKEMVDCGYNIIVGTAPSPVQLID